MTMALTMPPKHEHKSLLFSEVATDLDALQPDVAFLDIPHGRLHHRRHK